MVTPPLENSYAALPGIFFERATPTLSPSARVLVWNTRLAEELGIGRDSADFFIGKKFSTGSYPIAQAYAGHQFGHFTMLGDGRAILLGEWITPDGRRVDIQLKGAGQTAYSRRGDGKAALGPMLREYLISEAMHALGIRTTRSLAVVATGENVRRETILPGAVLTRVASSHLRVGTFEFAATEGINASAKAHAGAPIQALTDYAISRHYAECQKEENPPLAFFACVAENQAKLIAQWMSVGFIHGVMNTDNMSIAGETIDYGPCAFMDSFDAAQVFSSIDQQGRYAFGNQPRIAAWNLARLAETLLPLFAANAKRAIALAESALECFNAAFNEHWLVLMRAKFGLHVAEAADEKLITQFLALLQKSGADYTNAFRELPERLQANPQGNEKREFASALLDEGLAQEFKRWIDAWRERLARERVDFSTIRARMDATNPAVIARNYFVEEALAQATQGNLQPFHAFVAALQSPFASTSGNEHYRTSGPKIAGYRTFCGT